jgi:glycosyltransferase involved in cell wall biosynthesis
MSHGLNPFSDMRSAGRLRQVIDAGAYDVVHLNSTKAGVLGVPMKGKHRAKTIFTPHALRSFAYDDGSIKRRIALMVERRICAAADVIVACSASEAETVTAAGLATADRVKVIENGVDIERLSAPPAISRSDIGVPEDAVLIGTLARLSPQKDPETFIRAARLVAEDLPDAHFVIAGDGDLHNQMKTLAQSLGLADRMHLLGWRNDAEDVLKLFDVFVLTSRYEGGPFVILEAAAARKPIVACDSPGIGSVVQDGVNGLLTPAGDSRAVATAVVRIVRDQEMAETFVAAAFEQIAWPRRLEVMVDAWGELYRSLLETPVPAQSAQAAQRYSA